jgi:hypothetical protein
LATTYGYNNAGDLALADYAETTPDVSYTYDRQGGPAQMTGATTNDLSTARQACCWPRMQ